MKRILLTLAALGAAAVSFGSSGLAFNHGLVTTNSVVQDLGQLAQRRPDVNRFYASAYGDQNWSAPGNLEKVDIKVLEPGEKFTNSLVDQGDRPFHYPCTAKGGEVLVAIRARLTMQVVWVKRDCLNLVGKRVAGAVVVPREVQTTTNVQEAIDISLEVNISNVVTATASTAPITINITNITASAQPMLVGQKSGNTYFYTSSSNPMISGSWCFNAPTSDINVTSINNNSNASTNVNANNNVINVGNGTASGTGTGNGNSKSGSGNKSP